ncbi:MAG: diacylglycerol kinase family protein [Gammaproteobacteria bacterium]|nr:diacylglycerol kinase family protein [Gammaproteobacteria bacterium]
MSSLRIGCICNPDAARNRQLLAAIRPILRGISNAVYAETTSTKDYASLMQPDLIESLDLLILSGGDGTLQQGMSALLASHATRFPKLALLPAGSTNVAATDIGGQADLLEAVSALRERLPHLVTVPKQPLLIRASESDPPLAGFFLGVGAAPAAVARYRRIRKPVRGVPFLDAGASVVAIGGTILEIGVKGEACPHVVSGEMCVDGERTGVGTASLVLVTCLDGLFKSVTPWWGQGDAAIKYLQIGLGAPSLLKNIAGILRGKPDASVTSSPMYASGGAKRIVLSDVANFTIDGELFRMRDGRAKLTIDAGPEIDFVRFL